MVEKRQAAGNVRRMVLIETDRGGAQANRLGFPQRAGDEDLWHHDRLVLHRVMFADPELGESQLLGSNDELEILVERLGGRLRRGMKGHDEHAVPNTCVAPVVAHGTTLG